MDQDYMEMGDSGLVPLADGWFLHIETGNRISPSGRVYNEFNELVYDPKLEDE